MMIFKIYSNIAYTVWRNIFEILLILFFKLKVKGRENIPKKGPFIVASNHVSYLDPPIVGAAFRKRMYFITSEHLYNKHVLMALWYKSMDCIKVRRGQPDHRAIRKILDYLKKGRLIAMFPEGTRSEDGQIKEPLPGIGFLALKSQVPVVPCLIKGSETALPKNAKFFKPSSISVSVGKPIQTREFKYMGDKKEAYRLFSKKVIKNIKQLGR